MGIEVTHIWGYTLRMSQSINLYDEVLSCLRAKKIPQREIARGSGVPFSTVAKIAQGDVANPSVHTVQKLYDYFRAQGFLTAAFADQAADQSQQQEAA